MVNLGVLGGSFDPVHMGHLLLAEEAIEQAGLDRLLFMPTRIQPFKQDALVSPAEDRIAMLRIAAKGDSRFGVTCVETDAEGVSYTIYSLRRLRAEEEGARIHFILGADMFVNLHKWYLVEELLAEFAIVCGLRPGTDRAAVNVYARQLQEKFGARIVLIENRQFDVSSTEIRRRAREGQSLQGLVPEGVREYINERTLYRGNEYGDA